MRCVRTEHRCLIFINLSKLDEKSCRKSSLLASQSVPSDLSGVSPITNNKNHIQHLSNAAGSDVENILNPSSSNQRADAPL